MKLHLEFIQKITQLEKSFDVNSLLCNGINIWPLLRVILAYSIVKNIKGKAPTINSIVGLKNKYHKNLQFFESSLRKLDCKADILFYDSEFDSSVIDIKNVSYHRFSDAIHHIFHKEYNIKIITRKNSDKKFSTENSRVDLNFIHECLRINSLLSYAQKEYSINNLETFLNIIKKDYPNINKDYVEYTLNYFMSGITYIEKLFQKSKPKVLFVTCYYSPFNFILLYVANKLNIKTIDLQHGIQNDYHYMYTHWNRINKEGYELLPQYFWMWSNTSKKRIEKWSNKTTLHKTILGGNPFFFFIKDKIIPNDTITQYYPKDKINILIALQTPEFYSQEITNAINHSQHQNIIWHFKNHPIHSPNMFEEHIQKTLSFSNNIEYKFTNKSTIYETMRNIDICITSHSTVAYELMDLEKIPSIFVNNLIQKDYRLGTFNCKTSEEILNSITTIIHNKTESKATLLNDEPLIETNIDIIRQCLKSLLEGKD